MRRGNLVNSDFKYWKLLPDEMILLFLKIISIVSFNKKKKAQSKIKIYKNDYGKLSNQKA